MAELNKKTLDYLAELSRLDLKAAEEKKLLKDLQAILDYFKELQEVDTENIEPMIGGTNLKNVFREDEAKKIKEIAKGSESFPDTKNGYLKVPPIF